ncbi:MAG: hypothetical protein ACK5JG_16560 [Pseudomonadota bacterium]
MARLRGLPAARDPREQRLGQSLFRRYYDSVRHNVDRMDVAGRIGNEVDRPRLPMLYAFLLLGPLVRDPHNQAMLGRSTYEPDMWVRYRRALHQLFWHGAGPPDGSPGAAAR